MEFSLEVPQWRSYSQRGFLVGIGIELGLLPHTYWGFWVQRVKFVIAEASYLCQTGLLCSTSVAIKTRKEKHHKSLEIHQHSEQQDLWATNGYPRLVTFPLAVETHLPFSYCKKGLSVKELWNPHAWEWGWGKLVLWSLFSFISCPLHRFASFSSSLKTQNECSKDPFKFGGVCAKTGITGVQSGLERDPAHIFLIFCFKR